MSIAALVADSNRNNGQEIIVGTGAILEINGTTINTILPAPQSKYSISKLNYDGDAITGLTPVLGSIQNGLIAYLNENNPASGSVSVSAANTDGF